MKVSLVINTYNRLHSLPSTLDAVRRLRYPDIEVVVVDGPSTDGTMDYLQRSWADKVKICTCPEANLSKSRNVGINAASGDIVAFTDDDGIPEPDWLDRIVPAYADPKVGAVGGFVRNHTGVEYQTQYILSRRDGTSKVDIGAGNELQEKVAAGEGFVGLIGVNSTFRRAALLEIGGFDEEYVYFLDETDVVARLCDAGYATTTIADAQVHHKYAVSHIRNEKGLPRTWLPIARSTAYFCIRNASASTNMAHVFNSIEEHKQQLTRHTSWARHSGGLADAECSALLATMHQGFEEGVRDAFAHPWRRLITPTLPLPWKPLPRLKEASQRQHIALVTDLYPPRPCGGVAVFMHQLAMQLASIGHEVTVITMAEAGRPHTVDFEDGVWVHRLPPGSRRLSADTPAMPDSVLAVAEAVYAEIDRVDRHRCFDWVVGALWDLNIASVVASGRFRTAIYLVTSYGLMLDSKPEWKQNAQYLKHHVKKMIEAETWSLEAADLVLASTNAIRRDIESVYAKKIPDSRLAIQPFGLRPPSAKPLQRKQGTTCILFVGRFETRKGIGVLLESLPALLERHPDLVVRLVGDQALPSPTGRPYWENFADKHVGRPWLDRINALGPVSDEELEQEYANCDIFVAPSLYESFGLIYVEAMRYAKPCIGCDVGGVPEVVENGSTGLLVPPSDGRALGEALDRLVRDPALRATMGEAGRRRYEERFTLAAFADNLLTQLARKSPARVHH